MPPTNQFHPFQTNNDDQRNRNQYSRFQLERQDMIEQQIKHERKLFYKEYYGYKNDAEEEEEEEEEEDFIDEADKEFKLPPLNLENVFEYKRWANCQRRIQFHINRLTLETRLHYDPIIRKSICEARNTLIHSYQLLFLLDPSQLSYSVFEFHINNLERLVFNMATYKYSAGPEKIVECCSNLIKTLYICQ